MIYQNVPHHLRRDCEKMNTVTPICRAARQAQVSLVDEVSGLEGVFGAFTLKQAGSDSTQFRIDQSNQFGLRGRITMAQTPDQTSDIAIRCRVQSILHYASPELSVYKDTLFWRKCTP
jgi:hypothetical protein